jgi:glutamine synthetase
MAGFHHSDNPTSTRVNTMEPQAQGVLPTVTSRSNQETPEATVKKFLAEYPSVEVFVVQWVDICGVVRCRMLPASSFVRMVAVGGSFNGSPLDMVATSTEEIIPEMFAHFTDRAKIFPDLSTLKIAAHDGAELGNTAFVTGTHDYHLNLDARQILKRAVEKAEEDHGMTFLFGFELEICFLKPDSLEPAGPTRLALGNSSYAQRSVMWPVLNEISLALADGGIHIEQIIKEYGTSQWEIVLPPLPPLESVDAYVYSREVVKNIAYKYGMVATLYPVPSAGGEALQKNGEHIHMSATPGKGTKEWDYDTVMGGILSRIPALMAVGFSQVDSYTRVGVGVMGSGGYLGWGQNHRDMPVRRITENHWEIRTHDGTSNPYAMVTGLIAAALDPKPLTIKDPKSTWLIFLSPFQQKYKRIY